MEQLQTPRPDYELLLNQISATFQSGQSQATQAVNVALLETYWGIGRHIVEFEQGGNAKAEYGDALLERLSRDLKLKHGHGFSLSNLKRFRQFFLAFPIGATLSHQLTWSHYVELIKIDLDLERQFYFIQAQHEKWSVRELKRQKKTALFLRLAASKDKSGILQLAQKGNMPESPTDLLRDPYVLEFLKIPEPYRLSERNLEKRLLDNLQSFLLELGKGFTFVGRQYRITLNNEHYKIDLVFYHRILRCFVLIDLKTDKVRHGDIGQMNMYLGYFAHEENVEGDNPPIGIVFSREKDDLLVKYATFGMNSQLFVSKYQLYLPNEEELRTRLEMVLRK
jgi:predicted nuclease of restriction endonuclease-like (RecB) superfamily